MIAIMRAHGEARETHETDDHDGLDVKEFAQKADE